MSCCGLLDHKVDLRLLTTVKSRMTETTLQATPPHQVRQCFDFPMPTRLLPLRSDVVVIMKIDPLLCNGQAGNNGD